jgi:hypothetical protein
LEGGAEGDVGPGHSFFRWGSYIPIPPTTPLRAPSITVANGSTEKFQKKFAGPILAQTMIAGKTAAIGDRDGSKFLRDVAPIGGGTPAWVLLAAGGGVAAGFLEGCYGAATAAGSVVPTLPSPTS